jgi:hypothetical protein
MYIHNVKSTSTQYWGEQTQLDRRRPAIPCMLYCIWTNVRTCCSGRGSQRGKRAPPPPSPTEWTREQSPTRWGVQLYRVKRAFTQVKEPRPGGGEGSSLKRRGGCMTEQPQWQKKAAQVRWEEQSSRAVAEESSSIKMRGADQAAVAEESSSSKMRRAAQYT